MARGTQFAELINMFRDQAGRANSRALGQNELPHIKSMLRRIYRRLHADFNWPHLFIERDKNLRAGERYYSFPAEFDFERVVKAEIRENGTTEWYPLRFGIGLPEINTVDSDGGEREDYPYSWDIHEDNQFEVWPIPETGGHTIRFKGYSRAKPLTAESDTVDLDDDMIVLYALAEDAMRSKSADADYKAQEARQHYMRMRGRSMKGAPVNMKASQDRAASYRGIRIDYAERRD